MTSSSRSLYVGVQQLPRTPHIDSPFDSLFSHQIINLTILAFLKIEMLITPTNTWKESYDEKWEIATNIWQLLSLLRRRITAAFRLVPHAAIYIWVISKETKQWSFYENASDRPNGTSLLADYKGPAARLTEGGAI